MSRSTMRTVLGADGQPLYELPGQLEIDTDAVRTRLTAFIREQLASARMERAVLGLSGGVDSALVAHLVADAVGADKLLCVLLPYRPSSPASRADAESVVGKLGCASELVDVSPMVDAFFGDQPNVSPIRRGNYTARTRMAVLYDRSVTWGGLVAGTGNKTEALIGYTTMHGDNACAFNPVGDLFKSQLRQLAAAMGVPEPIIRKAPSADLWPGQTDEGEAGFSYPALDRILQLRIDEGRSAEAVTAEGFDRELVDRVDRMVAASAFKRSLPPVAHLGHSRHAHLDH